MADVQRVELALEGGPGRVEIAGVLMACVLVFALLAHFDGAAARDEAHRARTALAEQAAAARTDRARTEWRRDGDTSLGRAGPISVPVTSAWSAGTSPSAGHARVADGPFEPPSAPLSLLAGLGAVLALSGSMLIARSRR